MQTSNFSMLKCSGALFAIPAVDIVDTEDTMHTVAAKDILLAMVIY